MKKSLYIIVGSAIVISAIIFLRKKKIVEDKSKAEATALAETTLKSDFDTAVHNAGVVQAEAMNIDLINEKKAKELLPYYNGLWKQLLNLGNVTASDKRIVALRKSIKDVENQTIALGYRTISCPRCVNGASVQKI